MPFLCAQFERHDWQLIKKIEQSKKKGENMYCKNVQNEFIIKFSSTKKNDR